jgi:hypothetical protein
MHQFVRSAPWEGPCILGSKYVGTMPDWKLVHRSHVMAAMAEHDRLGSREFLGRYGFRQARAYALWHDGHEYPSKAILGVAYLHATGRPATAGEFSDDEQEEAKVLSTLGFDVVAEEQPFRPVRSSGPKPKPKPTPRKAEPVLQVCPRCFTALPATGVCDYCD